MDSREELTIGAMVRASAQRHAGRVAIEDGDTTLDYGQLDERRLASAAAFLSAGVKRGDRIAIWAPNVHEWIEAALGLHTLGAVLIPVNTRLKGAETAHVLNRSKARMLFTMQSFLGTDYLKLLEGQELPHLETTVVFRPDGQSLDKAAITWEAFLSGGEQVDAPRVQAMADAVAPDDLSDILFTSGTTGSPKGVMTTHAQNLRTFKAWSEIVGLKSSDRYLIVNPFFHAFGYKAGWLSAIMQGATILPHPVFDAAQVLKRVGEDRVSVLPGPPALFQALLANPDRANYDLSCLRLAVTGAASIPVTLIKRMSDELSFSTVITGYGLTESSGVVSMCRQDDTAETIANTCGRAIDGVELRCVDDHGKTVAEGEPGEVLVRGANVMRGYLDDEAATAEAVDKDGWLHTGDVGVLDTRGYLRITDRKKDMFIMGGFNCYPAEIENLMLANRQYSQVAVVGVEDARMGEVGMAFVVPANEASFTPDEVVAWCRDNMANYKVPRRVELVDALPMNASGKVLKFRLREMALEA